MIPFSEIETCFSDHFETRLKGRYICLSHIKPMLSEYEKLGLVEVVGYSEKGQEIKLIQIGNGPKKIVAWSQMHGNESTTTKAIFDFLKFLTQDSQFKTAVDFFKNSFTFCVIPILNPDGASVYSRENANGVDLNRDAANLTQKESRVLRKIFNNFKPDMCLNLHDQRTIYSLPNGKPATLSFLSPAADVNLSVTNARKNAMLAIARMNQVMQKLIPGQVGRYDDAFNSNCVGDTFQSLGVPTILFEAGHYPLDYEREITRKYIFYSLLTLFNLIEVEDENDVSYQDYFSIPENEKNFSDVILRNALLAQKKVDIVIQFQEKLIDAQISFIPVIDEIVSNTSKKGHKEINLEENEILINSHENVFVNEEIATISYKILQKPIFL